MLSKQSSKVNEAIVVFVGNNENVCFLHESTRVASGDMATTEEGEEALDSEEGMTIFEPYVADRHNRRTGGTSHPRARVSERDGRTQYQPQQRPPGVNRAGGEPEPTGISAAKDLFRKIRSSFSTAATSLPQHKQPLPPHHRTVPSAAGISRRPPNQGQQQVRSRQHRHSANQPTKTVPHSSSSAPVLHKTTPAATGALKPSSTTSQAPRQHSHPRTGQNRSRETSPCSPSVIGDMASYGPGSGRSILQPPPPPTPATTDHINPKSPSESKKPSASNVTATTSAQRAELRESKTVSTAIDGGKAVNSVHSISSDGHITLMSYSDVPRQRVAKARGGGGGSSRSGSLEGSAAPPSNVPAVLPQRVKQQLNKQDVLKRIGSIENNDVS